MRVGQPDVIESNRPPLSCRCWCDPLAPRVVFLVVFLLGHAGEDWASGMGT